MDPGDAAGASTGTRDDFPGRQWLGEHLKGSPSHASNVPCAWRQSLPGISVSCLRGQGRARHEAGTRECVLYAPDGRREGGRQGEEMKDRWTGGRQMRDGWMEGWKRDGRTVTERSRGEVCSKRLGVSTQSQAQNPMRRGSLVPSLNHRSGSSPEPRPPDSILSNYPGTHPQASQGPERISAPSSLPLLPGPTQA